MEHKLNLTIKEICGLLVTRGYDLEAIIDKDPSMLDDRLAAFAAIKDAVAAMQEYFDMRLAEKEETE